MDYASTGITIGSVALLIVASLAGNDSKNPLANLSYRLITAGLIFIFAALVWLGANSWRWFDPQFLLFMVVTLGLLGLFSIYMESWLERLQLLKQQK